MQGTVPRPEVAPRLSKHFVGLAADADEAEQAVIQLAMRIEDAMMLPFVIFADADGSYLTGYSGVYTPPQILKSLDALGVPAE